MLFYKWMHFMTMYRIPIDRLRLVYQVFTYIKVILFVSKNIMTILSMDLLSNLQGFNILLVSFQNKLHLYPMFENWIFGLEKHHFDQSICKKITSFIAVGSLSFTSRFSLTTKLVVIGWDFLIKFISDNSNFFLR